MSRRLLDWNPHAGLATWWVEDGEDWAQMMSQDPAALLDLNREAQNHCDPYNAARDVRLVARIPLIIVAKWPYSSAYTLGIFLAVDLLFIGASWLGIGLAMKKRA